MENLLNNNANLFMSICTHCIVIKIKLLGFYIYETRVIYEYI